MELNTKKLRVLLISRQCSLKEFAKAADLSPHTLSRIFKSKSNVRLLTIGKIAAALNVDCAELILENLDK